MNIREIERLLWERIDGTIEAGDAERLRRAIAGDPEAERLETEIARLASRLDGVEEVPVPGDLGDAIRRAVRTVAGPVAAPEEPAVPWWAGLSRLARPQPARRLVLVAATLVLALVGYRLVTGPSDRDDGTFVGTVGLVEPDRGTAPVRLELPQDRGALTISPRPGGLRVELETAASLGPARLEIAGNGLEIEGSARRGDAVFEVVAGEGGLAVDVTGTGGVVELELATAAGAGDVTFSVRATGETLVTHQWKVRPDKDRKPSQGGS